MTKFYHLLKFRRSKGLAISNKICGSVTLEHLGLLHHPQQPTPQHSTRVACDTTVVSVTINKQTNIPSKSHIISKLWARSWKGWVKGKPYLYPQGFGSFTIYGRHNNQHNAHFSTLHKLQLPDHELGDYQVSVKDIDVIRATHAPKIEYWLPQSNLDLLLPPLDVGVFFCYQKKEGASMSPQTAVKTIKNSLRGVLSAFYPLAGEIVPNSQGEPEVWCNNNGVEFVHAHADIDLKSIVFHHPDQTVKGKLVPKIRRGVLSVQVTELNCGAIIVSCAFDHRITDGASLNMFLVSWAEFARFEKVSIMPSFRRSILSPRRPLHYEKIYDNLYLPISSLPPPPSLEDKLHSRIYSIRAESINHLQSEASSRETRRSKFKSFTAFVWKLIGEECDMELNKTSRMGVVVSGRPFLSGNNEKELANYFGNILSIPYGVMSNHSLRQMQLNEVANKVHEFVSEVTREDHFRGLIDWVELHRPEPAVAKIYFKLQENDGDAIVVSSGHGLPITSVDFGWGLPYFGSYHFPWGGQTGYITTMPGAKNNGDWIVYAHLKQKHLDLIETKARHVFNPVTHSY